VYGRSVEESFVRFSVIDTGQGVSQEQMEHLFDRYWQAKPARRSGIGARSHHCQGHRRGAWRPASGRRARSAMAPPSTSRCALPRRMLAHGTRSPPFRPRSFHADAPSRLRGDLATPPVRRLVCDVGAARSQRGVPACERESACHCARSSLIILVMREVRPGKPFPRGARFDGGGRQLRRLLQCREPRRKSACTTAPIQRRSWSASTYTRVWGMSSTVTWQA